MISPSPGLRSSTVFSRSATLASSAALEFTFCCGAQPARKITASPIRTLLIPKSPLCFPADDPSRFVLLSLFRSLLQFGTFELLQRQFHISFSNRSGFFRLVNAFKFVDARDKQIDFRHVGQLRREFYHGKWPAQFGGAPAAEPGSFTPRISLVLDDLENSGGEG